MVDYDYEDGGVWDISLDQRRDVILNEKDIKYYIKRNKHVLICEKNM